MTTKAWRPLPHTFDEVAVQHEWPRTCEHCGIVVYGPGATHCPQRVLDAIAVAEAERDAALAVLRDLVALEGVLTTGLSFLHDRAVGEAERRECAAEWAQVEAAYAAAWRLLAGGKKDPRRATKRLDNLVSWRYSRCIRTIQEIERCR